MKQCKNCHASLPDDALFCPYCETEQIEKMQLSIPHPRRWKRLLSLLLALALTVGLLGVLLTRSQNRTTPDAPVPISTESPESPTPDPEPEPVKDAVSTESPESPTPEPEPEPVKEPIVASPEYWYRAADGMTYEMFLTFDPENDADKLGATEKQRFRIPQGGKGQTVSALCVYPNGFRNSNMETLHPHGALFSTLIDHIDVEAIGEGGSHDMKVSEPVFDEKKPFATAVVTVEYDSYCWFNELLWTITMKNGDVIYLHQYLLVEEMDVPAGGGLESHDMWYNAEDSVIYRLFLTFSESESDAEPEGSIALPLQDSSLEHLTSHLCVLPKLGSLSDNANFLDLVDHIQVQTGWIQHGEVSFDDDWSLAVASVVLDVGQRKSADKLVWSIYMKNGDIITLYQFFYGAS